MQTLNSKYYSNYKFLSKLLLLLIWCFLSACSGQNETKQILSAENPPTAAVSVINVNTASVSELEKLPHIGEQTAREIVEYREKFGKFRKPEHLLLLRGVSDKKFREMKILIKAE